MTKHVIHAEMGAPPRAVYFQGWRAGDFIFVIGSGPSAPDGSVKGDTIEERAELTINNIETILKSKGARLDDVVKVTVHLMETTLFPRDVVRRSHRNPRVWSNAEYLYERAKTVHRS